MKRWVLYAGAVIGIAAIGASSLRGTEMGKLEPVEVVWLGEENGQVCLETDTGAVGRGEDVPAALENMKASALGYIFMQTADYLIVQTGAEPLLQQVYDILRPSCMVCKAETLPDMEKVAAFLEIHASPIILRQSQVEKSELPLLREQEGRFEWVAK